MTGKTRSTLIGVSPPNFSWVRCKGESRQQGGRALSLLCLLCLLCTLLCLLWNVLCLLCTLLCLLWNVLCLLCNLLCLLCNQASIQRKTSGSQPKEEGYPPIQMNPYGCPRFGAYRHQ